MPFVVLLLVTGATGGYLVVHNLAARARARLDADLTGGLLTVRASAHDRELDLLESANFAANLQGVADAVRAGDIATLRQALESVLALKTSLRYVALQDREGTSLVALSRSQVGAPLVGPAPPGVSVASLTNLVRTQPDGASAIGFVDLAGQHELGLATAVCAGPPGCDPVGVAVVAIDAEQLLPDKISAAVYDDDGRQVAVQGLVPVRTSPPPRADNRMVRLQGHSDGTASATVYDTLDLQGRSHGTIAVTLPTGPALGSVRSAALRLAFVLLAVMAGMILIGVVLSRWILGQVRGVLDTTRALGSGDLGARAVVRSRDEVGALASGVNAMADQLQASYETLELRVAERTAEVQELLRERSDFFAALSHELRTPVAVFLAHADLLADPTFPKKAAWQTQSAATLRAAGEQVLGFVEAILALAKAETGGLDLEVERVSVHQLLSDLRPTLSGLAGAAGVRLRVRADEGLPGVLADRARLRDVVVNLVDNAVKYTPSGGRVDVAAVAEAGGVRISVTDTGVGIPETELDRVFEPFYRVRSTVTQGGQPSSGLGLALVKRLVEAHGGSIELTSEPDRGSTFTVRLPLGGTNADSPLAG
jgi:signal transduction histidine kinase